MMFVLVASHGQQAHLHSFVMEPTCRLFENPKAQKGYTNYSDG